MKILSLKVNIMKLLFTIYILMFLLTCSSNSQWKKSKLNGGKAEIRTICFHDQTIYSTTGDGLYKFNSSLNEWNKLSNMAATSMSFNGESIFAGSYGGGMYRSTDNGTTWMGINNGLSNPYVKAVSVNGAIVITGTITGGFKPPFYTGGVFLSTNNGDSWSRSGLTGLSIYALYKSNEKIFAGTNNGVYCSTNNGTTWDSLNIGLTNISITSIYSNVQKLYIGDWNGNIYLSTNNGNNWTKVTRLPFDSSGYNNVVSALTIWRNKLFATSGSGVHVSTDDGSTWTDDNSGLADYNITSLISLDTILVAGTYSKGIYTINDVNTNWQLKSTGLTGIPETNSFINIGSELFIGTYGEGVFRSTDNGATWLTTITSRPSYNYTQDNIYNIKTKHISPEAITSLVYNGSYIIAGSPYGLFLSEDTCVNWKESYHGNFINADEYTRILGAIGSTFFANMNQGFYTSVDNGNNWTLSSFWGQFGGRIGVFTHIGQIFIAGTGHGVYRSTDEGTSWNACNSGISDYYGLEVNAVTTSDNKIYLGAWGVGMYCSIDYGSSWNEINNGLTNHFVQCLTVQGSDIFVGTWGAGIFHSSNNGFTWNAINTGLSNLDIRSLFIFGNNIFAGSSSGVYYRSLSEVTAVIKKDIDVPIRYSLSQNYPNPFNPTTIIEFEIPTASYTKLELFDMLGRKIATLIADELAVGNYKKSLNFDKYSSGVYYYTLHSGKYCATKKMLLLK